MHLDDLIILIPSHSLEDFPTELSDDEAASLLNCFQVPWHPLLLATAGVMPRWQRADEPVEVLENRLIAIPSVCEPLLAAGWPERAAQEGALIVRSETERDKLLQMALAPFDEVNRDLDPELTADFLALGFAFLQLELLTRHMRQFSHLDESHFARELLAGAESAVARDTAKATTHLGNCFDVLAETRERFYPVDAYLIDLCLIDKTTPLEKLTEHLDGGPPVNLLLGGKVAEELKKANPVIAERIRDAWQERQAEVCGGEYEEAPSSVLPAESILWQFLRGFESYQTLFHRPPRIFARRRYGLFPQLPQILSRFSFTGAIHLALDDGAFPSPEQAKIRWEGPSGHVLDALASIPLPADAPATYLRFPAVMADSMSREHVATVGLAHWAGVEAPWYHDLRRIARYAPVLGKFVTLVDYFESSESPGTLSEFAADEYRSPYLFESVYRHEPDPVSRWVRHYERRRRLDSARVFETLSVLIGGNRIQDSHATVELLEERFEACSPEIEADAAADVAEQIDRARVSAAERLGKGILTGASNGSEGFLLLNPLSFARRVAVELPELSGPLPIESPVLASQVTEDRKYVVADVPAMGFTWIGSSEASPGSSPPKQVPLAEETVLRNEFCEVEIDPDSGGMRGIRDYGRGTNRMGQQLAMLLGPNAPELDRPAGVAPKEVYSRMVAHRVTVTSSGPALGEIVTEGDLLPPEGEGDARLAGFRQQFRLWKGRPVLEIETWLEIDRMPEGNPWQSYYAARFAWADEESSITRSVFMGATATKDRRWECPHYVELGSGKQRTTILTAGLPFLRRHGSRMTDLILVTEGERSRSFRIGIGIDLSYPIPAALDLLDPVSVVATQTGPPVSGCSGWFFHLDVKNVVVTSVRLAPDRSDGPAADQNGGRRALLHLLETEGRPVRAKLRCLRTPAKARQIDFRAGTLSELTMADDAVLIDLTGHEIAQVEIEW